MHACSISCEQLHVLPGLAINPPQRAIMVLRPGATRMRSLHGTALELYPNTTQHHTALLSLVK